MYKIFSLKKWIKVLSPNDHSQKKKNQQNPAYVFQTDKLHQSLSVGGEEK